jgi:oxygen-dependent protoporphyrinogen oxidase
MKVAIIGAGLAGLAAGRKLQKNGIDVTVFESSGRVGGRAVTIQRPDSADIVDAGTQYFHSNYVRALSLIRETGLSGQLRKVSGKTKFFDERAGGGSFVTGHRIPYLSSGSLTDNLKMAVRGLWRMATNPMNPYAVAKGSKIDSILATDRIRDPFEQEYSLRTLAMAGALSEPYHAPISYLHLVRLMRIIVMTDYLVLDGGISSLHERLAKDLDVRLRTPVQKILFANGMPSGISTTTGKTFSCDKVIVATPPGLASSLLPENGWEDERQFLSSISQPPAITVTLFLNRKPDNNVWSYVFRPDRNRLVSFCIEASHKNPAMMPSGLSTLQAWICDPAAERVIDKSDEAIANGVIRELARDFPDLSQQVESTHVQKFTSAIPQCLPGHNQEALRFLEMTDKRAGTAFCGDYFSGGYMESALWSVDRATDRIMATSDGSPAL